MALTLSQLPNPQDECSPGLQKQRRPTCLPTWHFFASATHIWRPVEGGILMAIPMQGSWTVSVKAKTLTSHSASSSPELTPVTAPMLAPSRLLLFSLLERTGAFKSRTIPEGSLTLQIKSSFQLSPVDNIVSISRATTLVVTKTLTTWS